MKKSRFTEEKIIDVLKHLEAGRKVSELKRLKTLVADLLMDLRPEIGWAESGRDRNLAVAALLLACPLLSTAAWRPCVTTGPPNDGL